MDKTSKNNLSLTELLSLNENVYDMFSVEELEARLQSSTVNSWGAAGGCGCHGTNSPSCNPVRQEELLA